VVEPARSTLGNRYDLQALLATGGMGQVWRAEDQLLGRTVAVKVLRSEYTGNEVFLARFRAEAHHAALLSHPNIAAVYDYGEEETIDGSGEHLAWLVMELVEGESLSAFLARQGALAPDQTLDVLRQTAAALAVAHQAGVVHRDVKPGNVLVRWDGTVKITDFGIAWSAGSVPLTQTGQVVGTAAYLSPEQAAGAHATAASDVYSLGMVGYECLTGRKAFDGDNSVAVALMHLRDTPDPLPEELPAGVRTLIERALLKDPAQRYPDGAAFVAAIDDVLDGRALPPVEHSDTQSWWLAVDGAAGSGATAAPVAPQPVSRRRRASRVAVPLAALVIGAGAAAGVLQSLAQTGPATTASVAQAAEPTTPSTPAGIVLDSDTYAGRPVDAVRQELTDLGLNVRTQPVRTDDVAAGTVIAVSSAGRQLSRGDEVVVRYAVATAAPDTSGERRRTSVDTVRNPVPTAPAPTSAAPAQPTAPASAAPTRTAPATSAPSTPAPTSSQPTLTPGPTAPTSPGSGVNPPSAPGTGTGSAGPTSPSTGPTGPGTGNGNGTGNGGGNSGGTGNGGGGTAPGPGTGPGTGPGGGGGGKDGGSSV
jgi:eukaryotic-like serine/threonine-protein kinase